MESLEISHQTLQQFMDAPFGKPNDAKSLKYESKYRAYRDSNKIKIESSIEYEKNYFIHMKVPSESQKGKGFYDVVIQFFTPNKEYEKQLTVENYYVQFFSNSPGFVYKYAALYKLHGYLIESLCDKFDTAYLNVLPDKANKDYELSYDSSIYYACRYLLDHKMTTLGKLSLKIFKTKPVTNFFSDIQDVEEVSIIRDVNNFEKNLKKEISADMKLSEQQEAKLKRSKNIDNKKLFGKKTSSKSTFKKEPSNSIKRISSKKANPKKRARKTTRKIINN